MDVTTLAAMAKQRDERYQHELGDLKDKLDVLEAERADTLTQRAPLLSAIAQLTNQAGQCEAAIAGNNEKLIQLQNEAVSLQQQGNRICESGHLKLSQCDYVQQRINTLQIDRAQGAAERQAAIAEHQKRLERLNETMSGFRAKCKPFDDEIVRLNGVIRERTQQQLVVLRDVQRLTDAIEDFEHYERVIAGTEVWAAAEAVDKRIQATLARLSQLELKRLQEEEAGKARRKAIDTLTHRIANQLHGFEWGVFSDSEDKSSRPFRLGPPHSTTFSVLETLVGDVVCLLDSTNPQSFHPGFLLHDSPREAEMSETLLWALVNTVAAEGGQTTQYIVTTSTAVPESLLGTKRLELHARDETGFFLGQRVGPGDQALRASNE